MGHLGHMSCSYYIDVKIRMVTSQTQGMSLCGSKYIGGMILKKLLWILKGKPGTPSCIDDRIGTSILKRVE